MKLTILLVLTACAVAVISEEVKDEAQSAKLIGPEELTDDNVDDIDETIEDHASFGTKLSRSKSRHREVIFMHFSYC